MEGWTVQAGYPVVTVEWADTSNVLNISQKRFLLDPLQPDSGEMWTIPISLEYPEGASEPEMNLPKEIFFFRKKTFFCLGV